MTDATFYTLMQQFLEGKGSEADRRELEKMVRSGKHEQQLQSLFDEVYNGPLPQYDLSGERIQHILHLICTPESGLRPVSETAVKPMMRRWQWAAAAAVVLMGTAGLFRWLSTAPKNDPATIAVIQPASDKAVLILADGSTLFLDTAGTGLISSKDGIRITSLSGGQLKYSTTDQGGVNAGMNTLKVPRGGKFKVQLPDGSSVWLNSASTLKYPAAFTGASREVELDGEAFFEISPGKIPFFVKSRNVQVQVLGTAFNIMAYKDEPGIATTLVQGKVAVKTERDRMVLQPLEQGFVADNAAVVTKTKPDMNEVLAWKNGEFRFNQKRLPYILRQVARWYDVDIEYQGALPATYFDGVVSRKGNVNDLLEILEETRQVHFKVEQGKIIVIPGTR